MFSERRFLPQHPLIGGVVSLEVLELCFLIGVIVKIEWSRFCFYDGCGSEDRVVKVLFL